MSIALSNAIPPPLPQPTVLPAQVQLAQGSAIPVPAIAVPGTEKGENSRESRNETGSNRESNDGRRGKLVDRYA
jgi:hypothetical protein